MPELSGTASHGKYLHIYIYQALALTGHNERVNLRKGFESEFQDQVLIKEFTRTDELLNQKYLEDDLHYIIVTEKLLDWAESFA